MSSTSMTQSVLFKTDCTVPSLIFYLGQDTVAKCRKIAEKVFGSDWAKEGADIYKLRGGGKGPDREQVWGIGHCESPFQIPTLHVNKS